MIYRGTVELFRGRLFTYQYLTNGNATNIYHIDVIKRMKIDKVRYENNQITHGKPHTETKRKNQSSIFGLGFVRKKSKLLVEKNQVYDKLISTHPRIKNE